MAARRTLLCPQNVHKLRTDDGRASGIRTRALQLEGLPSWPLDDRSIFTAQQISTFAEMVPQGGIEPRVGPLPGGHPATERQGPSWCGRVDLNHQLSRSERAASAFSPRPHCWCAWEDLNLQLSASQAVASTVSPHALETGAGRRTRTCFPRFTKPLHVLTCSTGMVPMNGVEPLLALYKGATLRSVTGILRGDAVITPPIRRNALRA